jgi:hypothetical protein
MMKRKLTLLVAATVSTIVLSGALTTAYAQVIAPPIVITGSVHIQLPLPCGAPVDRTLPILGGSIDIRPFRSEGIQMFDLTRLDMFLTPFSEARDCDGIHASVDFREIGVRLAGSVRFPGEPTGPRESEQFRFIIPKEQFLLFESIIDDAPGARQPETKYQRPSEDVFGLIDLRRRTIDFHVVLTSKLRLQAGCVRGKCLIDQIEDVTQTSDIRGGPSCGALPSVDILADTIPPTVSCTATAKPGNSFLVSASDNDCLAPVITLGSFTLGNGEVIQIQVTGTPGVRLLQSDRSDGIRHFQVGRGEGFVTATDAAGNAASAACR